MDEGFFRLFVDTIDTTTPAQLQELTVAVQTVSGRRGVSAAPLPDLSPIPVAIGNFGEAVRRFPMGQRVRVTAPISPKYLAGLEGTVTPDPNNHGRMITPGKRFVRVSVLLDKTLPRFANPTGIPVNCLEPI